MRPVLSILCLLLPLVVEAASLTATVESYNSASLSGEVPQGMAVSYTNQGSTKGQVVAAGKSTLTIQHWPDATIQGITLYVRSNQSSGAASVRVWVSDTTWLAAEGNYNQWPGIETWSETYQPMAVMSQAIRMTEDSVLKIEIEGSVNSVYLQKVEVTYTLTPPEVHTLTLLYPSGRGTQRITLMEDKAQDGVVLPSVPKQDSVLNDGTDTWYWYGWSEQIATCTATAPLCWQQGDWYGMDEDMTLYAVYINQPTHSLLPTKHYEDGEYALMLAVSMGEEERLPRLLSGNWVGGRIGMTEGDITPTQDGKWLYRVMHLSDTLRYQIDFEGDSLSIWHVATETWIGHNLTAGKNKACKWAWRIAADSTLLICGAWRTVAADTFVTCLTLHPEDVPGVVTAAYQEDLYHAYTAYWYLYPVEDIPAPGEALYSSLADYVALTDTPAAPPAAVKRLDQQGRLTIHTEQYIYTIIGTNL